MRGLRVLTALLKAELRARDHLLIAAAAAGLLVLLMPLAPGLAHLDPADVRVVAAWILAAILGPAVAIGLGATMIGAELSEGRLGFFLARPLSPATLWWARLSASLATTLGVVVLILGPAFILHPSGPGLEPPFDWTLAWTAIPFLLLTLLLASHAVGTVLRSRTAWLAVDAIGLLMVAGLLWASLAPLVQIGALSAAIDLIIWLAVLTPIALAVAGSIQLALGRADIHRSHRVLSITLLSLGIAISLGLKAVSFDILHPSLSDIESIDAATTSPRSSWMIVSGSQERTNGLLPSRIAVHSPTFLLDSSTGAHVSAGAVAPWSQALCTSFTPDGSMALVLELEAVCPQPRSRAVRWDLSGDHPRRMPSLLVVEEPEFEPWALSSDGARVAYSTEGLLSVYDLDQEREAASFKLQGRLVKAWFVDRDLLRLYLRDSTSADDSSDASTSQPEALRIIELDIANRGHRPTGTVELPYAEPSWFTLLDLSPDGSDLLVGYRTRALEPDPDGTDEASSPGGSENDRWQTLLVDSRTGELASPAGMDQAGLAIFLCDGRIATTMTHDGRSVLRILDIESGTHNDIDLGRIKRYSLLGENDSGQLLLTARQAEDGWSSPRKALWVDLATGEVTPVPEPLDPRWPEQTWFAPAISPLQPPGPLTNRLFLDKEQGSMVLLSSDGSRRILVGSP
jgi:ABC-type transport system involved in multi-copper enzyme maturation permease subunit